jgi:formiminotetrahydrofolate cyclodeaminase
MTQRLTDLAVSDLVARLATSDPVPGGGSASALAGAMAAALVEMVVALTVGRPAAADHEAALAEIGARAAGLRTELLRLAEVDADAYAAVVVARRMPKVTDAERAQRRERITDSVREATLAPLEVVLRSAETLALAESLAPIGNRNAASDVGVAGLLAAAAIRGAAMNVEINLPSLREDDGLRREAGAALEAHLADLGARERALASAVGDRIG